MQIKNKVLVILLGLLLTFFLFVTASAGEVVKESNILYRETVDSDYAKEQCRLDVYYPKGVEGYPTIVWFHGGGLREGVRQTGEYVAKRFTSEGMAVVLVSYRLSPKVKCPVYIDDSATAVAWTFKNITKYGGDPDKIFVSGHSAGGYLTSIVGIDKRYLNKYGISAERIAGLIPISGQTVTHSTIRRERGIPDEKIIVDELAPIYYVDEVKTPFLCICGDDDIPLRTDENRFFVAALKAAGNTESVYIEIKGRDHSSIVKLINELNDEVALVMLDFIRKRINEKNK
ncbi:MAG: alpha/beta hydrolase [Planctomycetota bacterium]|jgi:acetyl esterase/lipase